MDILHEVRQEQVRTDLPDFDPGDTLRVNVRVREGDKERIQVFEGVCPQGRPDQRDVHGPKDRERRGCGARLPAALADRRVD